MVTAAVTVAIRRSASSRSAASRRRGRDGGGPLAQPVQLGHVDLAAPPQRQRVGVELVAQPGQVGLGLTQRLAERLVSNAVGLPPLSRPGP